MIEEMSFKCLLDVFWPVLIRHVFKSKIYGGAIFANMVNEF